MALRYFANAPATTLVSGVTAAATSINVASVTGLPVTYPYTLILDRGQSSEEVVEVTGASGTTLTVTRGVDSTTAFDHSTNAAVEHGLSARDLREANQHINASENVHGINGEVVGTTDAQSLNNKDLSHASNVFPASLVDYVVPVGALTLYAGATAPAGWVVCDGSELVRSEYPLLFAAIGTTFGAGDGSTTFNVPNLEDRVPVGASGTKALGSEGGSSTKSLSISNLPAHTHTINHDHASTTTSSNGAHRHDLQRSDDPGGSVLTIPFGTGSVSGTFSNAILDTWDGNSLNHTHSVNIPAYSGNSGSTGSGDAFDVTNPYLAMNYIIKAA